MKIDETGKPMMSDADILAIDNVMRKLPANTRCLEWGSGNSTIYFPMRHDDIGKWVSIEHNGHYIDYLSPKVDKNLVTLIWVQDDADYVDCVKKNIGHYDFILIDGISEQREKCLEEAYNILAPGGVILLHDAQRREYKDFISKYPNRKILSEGEIPDGEFFIHQGLTAFYK